MLVNEGLMTLDSIPRYIGLSAGDIEMLTSLPEEYFKGGALSSLCLPYGIV